MGVWPGAGSDCEGRRSKWVRGSVGLEVRRLGGGLIPVME